MMKFYHIVPVIGALALAGGAQAQTVDIDYDTTGTGVPNTVDVTGATDGIVISNTTVNTGAQGGDADGNSIDITITGEVTDASSALKVKDNGISAAAYGADGKNSITIDGQGGVSANIGNLGINSGAITSTASTNEIKIDVGGFTAGDAELIGNSIESDGSANFASNTVTGDFSDQAQTSSAPQATTSLDSSTPLDQVDTASINYSIGNLQHNTSAGTVTSDADSNTIQITSAGDSSGTDEVTAEVDNNSISALGRGNVGVNTIDGTNGGKANSYGISSAQIQEASVTTSANGNTISFNTGVDISSTLVTVNNNQISATTVGNQVVNSIKVSQ